MLIRIIKYCFYRLMFLLVVTLVLFGYILFSLVYDAFFPRSCCVCWMCHCQVDLRHRQVAKSVEDVQKIIKDLTAEVSSKDARFQSIANSGVHNTSLKVIIHTGLLSIKRKNISTECFSNHENFCGVHICV